MIHAKRIEEEKCGHFASCAASLARARYCRKSDLKLRSTRGIYMDFSLGILGNILLLSLINKKKKKNESINEGFFFLPFCLFKII